MLYTLLNAIREHFEMFLISVCFFFYYSLEPIERVVVDYNRFVVINKVDSLIKHNNQLRESNKMLQSYSDSLLVCNNDLLIENNKLLQEINTNDKTLYQMLFIVTIILFTSLLFITYKLNSK